MDNNEKIINILEEILKIQKLSIQNSNEIIEINRKYEKISHRSRIITAMVITIVLGLVLFSYLNLFLSCPIKSENKNNEGHFDKLAINFSEAAKLEIIDQKINQSALNISAIGTVKNNGENRWNSVSIVLELYDSNGKLADLCEGYINGAIAPAESRNFKISCGNCSKDETKIEFASHKLFVRNAYYDYDS